MKRLIFTVTNDLNYDQRMIRICTTLSRAGYDVILVGRQKKASLPLSDHPFNQVRLACYSEKGKLFYLEFNIRLLFYLIRQPFDGLCSVDLDTLLPGVLASRLKGKLLLYDAHEYFSEVPEVVDRPAIKKAWEILAQLLLPYVRKAYTVGPQLARELTNRYDLFFESIRNLPYSRSKTPISAKHSPPVILYQGALNEGRGLEESIEAMQQIEHAQLWLAGEGGLSASLRARVVEQDLQEKVKFLGYVRPENLPAITAQATLGLNLLHQKGLSYYLSLANKTFDYIQAGLPALNPDFPEYRDLHQKYGCLVLVPSLDPKAIAQQINTLLNHPRQLEHLIDKCYHARKDLCWEKEEIKLLQLYQDLFPLSPLNKGQA